MKELSVAENLAHIYSQIERAAQLSGRSAEDITLVAVTKKQPLDRIVAAVDAGQLVLGENYVQEGKKKILELHATRGDRALRFHFIGPLQSNKVKDAVGLFDVIETVHRKEIAERISLEAEKRSKCQDIFIQINISEEPTKSGVMPEAAKELCRAVITLPGIAVKGLMSIGTFYSEDAPRQMREREFIQMAGLKNELESELGIALPHLSMGMSDDYPLAVEKGATVVRLGTALFGPRE